MYRLWPYEITCYVVTRGYKCLKMAYRRKCDNTTVNKQGSFGVFTADDARFAVLVHERQATSDDGLDNLDDLVKCETLVKVT